MDRRRALVTVLAGGGGAAASPLLTSLVAYYKLDETSGNRVNSVSAYYPLGVQGTVGNTTGKLGNCATMATGAANYLLLFPGDDALLALDWASGFTICGWLYVPTAYDDRCCVLAKDVAGTSDWQLRLNGMSGAQFIVNDSVSGNSLGGETVTLNVDTWYFLAGRYNPSTKKAEFSLNTGPWRLGAALSNDPANAKNRLAINRYSSAYGTCRYDEVGLWSRYLSDAEIIQLYNSGAGVTYPF